MFHFPMWFGHMTCRNENKLSRIVSVANKIADKLKSLTELYIEGTSRKVAPILSSASLIL